MLARGDPAKVELRHDAIGAHHDLATALALEGRHEESEAACQQAVAEWRAWLKDHPDDAVAFCHLGKALGTLAHDALLRGLGLRLASAKFAHGAVHALPGHGLLLADSYHVSRYNTSTRRLTTEMFEAVVQEVVRRAG